MTLRELLGTTAALLILTAAGPLAAQDTAGARSEDVAVEDDGSDGGGDRLADLEEAIKAQQDRIDALEKKEADAQGEVEELKGQLEEMKEEQEMAQLEALDTGEDYATEKKMQVYGFFDTTFVKNFFRKNSPFDLYFPNKSSFMMSSVNLYFKSQMTQTLSAMVETKLIYFPHGWEESYPTVVVMNNDDGTQTTVLTDGVYGRTDTQVRDQNTLGYTRYGGIAIERAHLTYKPFDWLGIMAGRYLTPYGIWNVDHGTPVLLSIRVPYLQTRESVPLSQMGVQVFGRFYPGPDLFFDYAFTVSNGRGPIDTIMDLDENKGLGLRLRLSYEGKNLTVSAGAYGYMGEYTDSQKEIFVQVDPNLHLDESADPGADDRQRELRRDGPRHRPPDRVLRDQDAGRVRPAAGRLQRGDPPGQHRRPVLGHQPDAEPLHGELHRQQLLRAAGVHAPPGQVDISGEDHTLRNL